MLAATAAASAPTSRARAASTSHRTRRRSKLSARTPEGRPRTRILEATAPLLETTSFDELGTKLIAAEAGVSVGVLYRYFTDKEAIVASLVRGWLEMDVRITEEPLPARSQELLAAFADRFRKEPGYRRVWYYGPRIDALRAYGRQTDLEIAERVHKALVRGYAMPDTEQFRRRARLAVEVGGNLLDLAFRTG
ncbi:TetR/AcrR family transcriptional regulator [Streptomyces goshikiensis]|uniref:TetR/AcrR family transcriptional regulator n=1 Tax=Streptomyces goshikiensis TaxID=1942 RepID=UPI003679266A